MAFVDTITLHAAAGNGGDGVVRWQHFKFIEYGGPGGGNGGDGGDVYIEAVRDILLLSQYTGNAAFLAERGEDGGNSRQHGAKGKDCVIKLPVGSLVTNKTTREHYELTHEGQRIMVLKGGRGGAGNAVFKSSKNRSPEESLPGGEAETADLEVELRIIADIGLTGLPNAGKTSLLNALTGAQGKVGAYAFTTLEPNVGVLYGYLLADIPGLIEGASEGKGLGSKFLRHVARTELIVHCVSLESETPMDDYNTVRAELDKFEGGALAAKREVILLTKSDTRDMQYIKDISARFTELGKTVLTPVTILEDENVQKCGTELVQLLREKKDTDSSK